MLKMRAHAVRGLERDALDPFVNLTMGRTEWLDNDLDAALPWIERSIELSPNYAFAIYNSALVGTLLGDGKSGETRVTKAIALSPIDPLNYAMLATRALSHAVGGDFVSASDWAASAVRSPNAHVRDLCNRSLRARIERQQPEGTALRGTAAPAETRLQQVRLLEVLSVS